MLRKKNILITGNLGYVGIELTKYLKRKKNINLIGFDINYFKKDKFNISSINKYVDYQINDDIRRKDFKILKQFEIDTIIHLAAISNDPMGNFFLNPTREINIIFTKKLIDWAKKNKIKKFIFASSCSVYGFSKKICNEKSKTNPLTQYAKSKFLIENYLKKNSNQNFKSIALRFSTACGQSDMLRLDLVLNDFVASAISSNQIRLLSDGKAIRPLIDVIDMSKIFLWAIKKNFAQSYICINAGNHNNNFRIIELAYQVKKFLPSTKIILDSRNPDNRSYKVKFTMLQNLFPGYKKMKKINYSIKKLIYMLKLKKFKDKNFRQGNFMRLMSLKKQIIKNKLNKNLEFK